MPRKISIAIKLVSVTGRNFMQLCIESNSLIALNNMSLLVRFAVPQTDEMYTKLKKFSQCFNQQFLISSLRKLKIILFFIDL